MTVGQAERAKKRRKVDEEEAIEPSTLRVYFADGVSEFHRKAIAALLKWRYGISQRSFQHQDADIVVVPDDVAMQKFSDLGKMVIKSDHPSVVKSYTDQYLEVVGNSPLVLIPPPEDPWVSKKLQGCILLSTNELADKISMMPSLARNPSMLEYARRQLRADILTTLDYADYVVVLESAGPMHVAIGAIASVLGKLVIAEAAPTSVLSALADITVDRKEDLVAIALSTMALQ